MLPPVSSALCFAIRKPATRLHTLGDYIADGLMTERQADALRAAQKSGDVLAANDVLMDAYDTDVRPLLAEWRTDRGLDPDPLAAFKRSGYQAKINAERVGGAQAGWGA